jgi:hypothetical protein
MADDQLGPDSRGMPSERQVNIIGGARLPNVRLPFATPMTFLNESWSTPRNAPSREEPSDNFVLVGYPNLENPLVLPRHFRR